VDAIMALMTDDCVFENTAPPPDGERFEGQAAVRKCWQDLFASAPSAHFTAEEVVVFADRAIVRWSYRWAADGPAGAGHVRGVDLIRVRDGKVAEKLSYVKG
jgi:ketosteroid isomerase-like protein